MPHSPPPQPPTPFQSSRSSQESIDLEQDVLTKVKNELKKMRQQGNKVILEQIEQNKLERIKQKEIEEKERLELLKKIEEENEK